MLTLSTQRLRLFPLTAEQLAQYRDAPPALESALGFPVSRALVTERVRRALGLKLVKLATAPAAQSAWFTYWLAVVAVVPFGAGLLGFKGPPDDQGAVEIGYGLDPDWQSQGLTTEAARALVGWAFQSPNCQVVRAPETRRDNPASHRVLAKLGMSVYAETDTARSWQLTRSAFLTQRRSACLNPPKS